MFTFNYYELYRNSKDPVQYRGMIQDYPQNREKVGRTM